MITEGCSHLDEDFIEKMYHKMFTKTSFHGGEIIGSEKWFLCFFFYNIRLSERMKILWNNVDRLILFCCWSTSSIECDVENKNIETIKEDEIFLYANLGKSN